MLHDALVRYLADIESAVRELSDVYVEHIHPHYPDLKSFPHHRHSNREVIAAEKSSIQTVLEEVKSITQIVE